MANLRDIQQEPSRLTIRPIKAGFELKKLSQKHKTIIALHSQGVCRYDVGAIAGCTPEYVSMVVAQPLAKAYLQQLEEYMDSRLRSLYSKSVDAIDKGLENDDPDVALKAARLQMEAAGKLKPKESEAKTAEDVVAAILSKANLIVAQNVQINQGASNGPNDINPISGQAERLPNSE